MNSHSYTLGVCTGLCLLFFGSCASGPNITIYISDPAKGGMEFSNASTGASGFVDYSKTDKFIAVTPQDAQTFYDYCGEK